MTSELVRVGIAGTGSYVPEKVVPNSYFESFLDTSDEWIQKRTGIQERRYAAEGQHTSDLCVEAARQALDAAGITAEDLDLVVVGTLTPDYPLPSTACIVQDKLGASKANAFDVAAACTGFMTAMQVAEAYIASGRARNVLAIGAEVLSRVVNNADRGSCILFGDGAGAAILRPHADCKQGELLKSSAGADGSGYDFIHIPGGGSAHPATHETVDSGQHSIHMRGRDVFRFAVTHMSELIQEMLEGEDISELGLIVPHQVNRRIIESALERVNIDPEMVLINIDKFANTSAATVPIGLDQAVREGRIESGKLLVLVAFGAGLTWGASLVRW